MASSENAILNLANSPIAKIIGTAFLIGTAWARLEYKLDDANNKVLKKIDEHIISDGYDKRIQSMELSELRNSVNINSANIEKLKEAIKPERVEIKNKRYR